MHAGKLRSFEDKTEIHGIVGLGRTPNERSRIAAEELVKAAANIGLRVVIGNNGTHREYDRKTDDFVRDEEGNIVEAELAALGPRTTTNHAYDIMKTQKFEVPALQVEMPPALRLLPTDFEDGWHKDEKARAMGVHSGYLLMRATAKLMTTGSAQ